MGDLGNIVADKGDMKMTSTETVCNTVAQPINMITTTEEDNMTTMNAIVYVSEKAMKDQTMLVVDTNMDYSLKLMWEYDAMMTALWNMWTTMPEGVVNDPTGDITDPLHVVDIVGIRKAMPYMLAIPCKHVQAILVSTASLDDVAKDTHAMLGYQALADAQRYTGADGVVPMKNGYGALMEELKWDNVRLPQHAQQTYVRRPSPGGNTLTQGTKALIADTHVTLTKRQNTVQEMSRLMTEVPTTIDTQAMDAEGRQTWVDPVDGHIITVEEYLDGIASRVAPQHHNDMTGRPSVYAVDEMWMNVVEDGDHIVPAGDEHWVYTTPKHPAGTTLGIGYLVAPTEAGRNVTHQFGVAASVPVNPQGADATGLYGVIRTQLCTGLIPRLGRSCMRDTPSHAGYHTRHVKQADGTYRNVPVTCQETRLDGTVCGGYYKTDSRGYMVCLECGVEYEMTEEEQAEELKHKLHNSHSDYTPDSVNNDYDLEDHLAALDAEDAYANTTYAQDTDGEKPVITAATVARTHQLGGHTLDGKMGAMAARLERNIAAWRAEVAKVPADEQRAKARAHEKAERDAECKKANKEAAKGKRVRPQRDIYESRWRAARKAYAKYVIRALIASGITDTKAMLDHLPPHCGADAYGDYRREMVEAGEITVTNVGRQRIMAVVPRVRPVREQYPAKYDGRAKYGNLEYRRGTIVTIANLHPPVASEPYMVPSEVPNTAAIKLWKTHGYTPVERPLISEYTGGSTNSDRMGKAPMYRTGKECAPARNDNGELDAWKAEYTRKLVYELLYERTMINKGQ